LVGDRQPGDVLADILKTSTRFRWSTVVYSAVKKSGKTRVSALVASWLGYRSIPFSEIYCLANDGKQSSDRVLMAVKKSIMLATAARKSGTGSSVMCDWEQVALEVRLSSNQFIQAIPVDPEGEAGSQPTGTFWSEMWGFKLGIKEKLWTELTIPPTRWGRAIRWVESYAGYIGESDVLWNLYLHGVDSEEHPEGIATRHPDFPDLPVYINEKAKQLTYWDHEPRMPWQNQEYYAAESDAHSDDEFDRVHKNIWVSPLQQAIPLQRWDALAEKLPPIRDGELLVLSVDLSVSGDGTALVAVSKHPRHHNKWAIRSAQLWVAPPGQKILYQDTIIPAIKDFCLDTDGTTNPNVICVVYDEYQAHLMATDLQYELGVWFDTFSQGKGTPIKPGRPVADKMFFDLVMSGRIAHDGDPVFRQHVNNAAGSTTTDGKYLRFVKKTESPDCRIDLLVAASMAICTISRLNV
jgi:phage terminase large subunit-like protein